MSFATLWTRAKVGMDAPLVSVEVHLSNGLPGLTLVGLPEAAVKESKDRVRSAIINSGFDFPSRRLTINLAPAELPKHGGRFDLPIALGILIASGQLQCDSLDDFECVGELGLSGDIRPVDGLIPALLACGHSGKTFIVPIDNREEAALCHETQCFAARSLAEVCGHIERRSLLSSIPPKKLMPKPLTSQLDLNDIKRQHQAKRALIIAAAGGHHLLMMGPPGTGKTMLATRLSDLLPPLERTQALEMAAIQSLSHQGIDKSLSLSPPFRSPHHTCSGVALVGGGSRPKPGEVSLAHHGVLFLDELPEFSRKVLDVLREPLENGEVHIARASQHVRFPAEFQLVAALNPCPCGYYTIKEKRCSDCSDRKAERYQSSISGPLLDRIDLHIEVPPIKKEVFFQTEQNGISSKQAKKLIYKARNIQLQRAGKANVKMSHQDLNKFCFLDKETRHFLENIIDKLNISARVYHKIIKVARTIADLDASNNIERSHLTEAISYRRMDRNFKTL